MIKHPKRSINCLGLFAGNRQLIPTIPSKERTAPSPWQTPGRTATPVGFALLLASCALEGREGGETAISTGASPRPSTDAVASTPRRSSKRSLCRVGSQIRLGNGNEAAPKSCTCLFTHRQLWQRSPMSGSQPTGEALWGLTRSSQNRSEVEVGENGAHGRKNTQRYFLRFSFVKKQNKT